MNGRRQTLQYGLRAIKCGLFASHHNRQCSRRGPQNAARDRSIDHLATTRRSRSAHALTGCNINRGAVDQNGIVPRCGDHGLVDIDPANILSAADHCDDEFRLRRHIRSRTAYFSPSRSGKFQPI